MSGEIEKRSWMNASITIRFACSSVMKNSQEMVRASLLPLFNNMAEDLNQTVQNLEQKRFSHIKGTLQRGTTSLSYIHMVLLPVLASMLDHLGKNNYGVDVFGKPRQVIETCTMRLLQCL